MASNTWVLGQAVHAGDLILVYCPNLDMLQGFTAHMLLVKSAPEESNPDLSSVMVQKVKEHSPARKGCWTIDGPKVYYCDTGEAPDYYKPAPEPETTLVEVLKHMDGTVTRGEDCAGIIVNPHGRDVLKYYWVQCESCAGFGTFVDVPWVVHKFPEFADHPRDDLTCPVCMGYDFTVADKQRIDTLDELKDRKRSAVGINRLKLMKQILALTKARYDLAKARKEEMGITQDRWDRWDQRLRHLRNKLWFEELPSDPGQLPIWCEPSCHRFHHRACSSIRRQ
ncbi:hypothetical protein N7474_002789 [Penicillium riverlandense]|uniref:uncharacterized protein n=1 Tax=Penicillium riverlandense TaxID=1903569 RepID=UPI00254892EA|nr:uncharacterized protein N7474_002789 [Penicillium riverlandense]KAJ5825651.1 hypothetical protein N7474_002789 [Penicillium riverlandense]